LTQQLFGLWEGYPGMNEVKQIFVEILGLFLLETVQTKAIFSLTRKDISL
jgi:DNA-binding ferritin-like protein (Dps family)